MKKISITLLGIGAFLLALTLNFHYAVNDYGIMENTLATQVLAQSSSGSGGSGSGSGSNSNTGGSGSSGGPSQLLPNHKMQTYDKDTGESETRMECISVAGNHICYPVTTPIKRKYRQCEPAQNSSCDPSKAGWVDPLN